jgi:hypothetical protein
MNPLTNQLLQKLWDGSPTFRQFDTRLRAECKTMSPAEAAVIGRDLLLRREALYEKLFRMAAFLASDGTAGNDGFMDFTDCVALLPEARYQRILQNPDELVDDPVSSDFAELYLISAVCSVFEQAILDGQDGQGFLYYLVLGEEKTKPDRQFDTIPEEEVKQKLPRLHAKFGHLLRSFRPRTKVTGGATVKLDDLIG